MLHWYRDSGVDIALEDAPVNQFEQSKIERELKAQKPKTAGHEPTKPERTAHDNRPTPVQNLTIPDEKAIANALELATSAKSLDDLRDTLEGFHGCNLRRGAKHLVFGEGNQNADLMFVSDAPGTDEDMHGQPLIGSSGQLYERMLKAIGLNREEIYTANIIPWRPPGNRAPTPQEIDICRPFIERQIALVKPKILIFLGATPAKILLGHTGNILRLRGQWKQYGTGNGAIDCLITFHPAHLLTQPAQKKMAWQDLLALKAKFSA